MLGEIFVETGCCNRSQQYVSATIAPHSQTMRPFATTVAETDHAVFAKSFRTN